MRKIMGGLAELLSPNDPVLVEKTLARMSEQDQWNDLFSTKLIELLDTNDGLKTALKASDTQLEKALQVSANAETLVRSAEALLSSTEQIQKAVEKQARIAAEKDERAELALDEAATLYRRMARYLIVTVATTASFVLTALVLPPRYALARDFMISLAALTICLASILCWRLNAS